MKELESKKELFLIVLATLVCYYLTLVWIFPGYFSPLYPHHNDFYNIYPWPEYFGSWIDRITVPRCLCNAGFLVAANISSLDPRLYPLIMIVLSMTNVVMTLRVIRNISGQKSLFWPMVPVYLVAIFAHPFFYSIYTYQFCLMLSFFLTLIIMLVWTRPGSHDERAMGDLKWLVPLTALVSFTYETFMVPTAVFWLYYCLFSKGERRKAAVWMLVISSVFSLSSLLYTRQHGAYFMGSDPSTPYFVNMNPASIIRVWFYYVKAWLCNWPNIIMMALGTGSAFLNRGRWKEAVLLIVMSAATFAPISLQPNHMHDSYYSWSAVPLSFGVIFFAVPAGAATLGWPRGALALTRETAGWVMVAAMIAITAGSLKNYAARHYPRVSWHVAMETINRNILQSLPYMAESVHPGQKVLVAGLCFPFHPFFASQVIDGYFGEWKNIEWTILPREKDRLVKKPGGDETDFSAYDHVFIYGNEGRLMKHYPPVPVADKDLACQ